MADVFYVQHSEADPEGLIGRSGWQTFPHCFQNREDAERQMAQLEKGTRVVQVQDDEGQLEDVTERLATVYRVISTTDLEGEETIREASEATQHRPDGFPPGTGQTEADDA